MDDVTPVPPFAATAGSGSTAANRTEPGPSSSLAVCRDGLLTEVEAVLAVVVFGYLGVLARIGLSAAEAAAPTAFLRELGCGGGFLAANLVGCALMGCLVRLAVPFRRSPAGRLLYLGLSTGFCGCCTTFASWQYFIAHQLFAGVAVRGVAGDANATANATAASAAADVRPDQAGQAVVNILIHSALFLAAFDAGYTVGQAVGRNVRCCCLPGTSGASTRALRKRAERISEAGSLLGRWKADDDARMHRIVGVGAGDAGNDHNCALRGTAAATAMSSTAAAAEDLAGEFGASPSARAHRLQATLVEAAAGLEQLLEHLGPSPPKKDGSSSSAAAVCRTGSVAALGTLVVIVTVLTAVFGSLPVVAASGAGAAGASSSSSHVGRDIALALLLSPIGSSGRYFLSKYNSRPTRTCGGQVCCRVNSWNFPFYTFLVNMVGTGVVVCLKAGITTDATSTGGSSVAAVLWRDAVSTGLCGSLSTVSSFIAETRVLHRPLHAWRYFFLTVLGAQCLALALSGTFFAADAAAN